MSLYFRVSVIKVLNTAGMNGPLAFVSVSDLIRDKSLDAGDHEERVNILRKGRREKGVLSRK